NWTALQTSGAVDRAEASVARAVKHAISRALAPLPDDRFPTAPEFAAALGGPTHRTSVPTRAIFAGRRGRRIAFGLGIVVALLGTGTAVHVLRGGGPRLNERRVVVAVIENHTGDSSLNNVGHMAADWVTQGLAQTGIVEVVPSMSVITVSKASAEHGPGRLDAAGLRTLGRETGAGTVVWGAYYRQGDSIRFQVQVSAARDGTDLAAARRRGSGTAAGDGRARDPVRLAPEPLGKGRRPASQLRGVPRVHPGPRSHGAVRLAGRHRSFPARRARGHDLPPA